MASTIINQELNNIHSEHLDTNVENNNNYIPFEQNKIKNTLKFTGIFTIITLLFIIFFLVKEALPWFENHTLSELIFGTKWNPGAQPPPATYGAAPIIYASIVVTIGAMIFAIPLGIGTAIFIAEIAPFKLKLFLKSAVELLAGIPSVVYGYFGLTILTLRLKDWLNLTSGSSWLAASILLGIMALPTIISVTEDAITSVPFEYKEASLGMGASKWQTIRKILVPSASSGITAAIILGLGRAIGETMAVMMVAGNTAIFPDPLWDVTDTVRTITATLGFEIKEISGGDWYNALFMLALILFTITLVINSSARYVMRKMNEKFCPPSEDNVCSELDSNNKFEQFFSEFELKIEQVKIKIRNQISKFIEIKKFKTLIGNILKIFIYLSAVLLIFVIFGPLTLFIMFILLMGLYYLGLKLNAKIKQKIAFTIISGITLSVLLILAVIIIGIFQRGIGVISWEYLTGEVENTGRSGGILPPLLGTIWLILGDMIIATPLGLGAGIYLAEYTDENNRLYKIIHSAIDNLNGTPSIIFGLFGLIFLVLILDLGISYLSGIIIMSLMILPTIIRTTEEAIKAVPKGLREASYSVGASKWHTIKHVVLPSAKPSIMTGLILAMGRIAGETAPIMYTATAFTLRFHPIPWISNPIQILSYHLFYLSTEVPGGQEYAGGAALVLMLLVIFFFGLAAILRFKYQKELE